MEREQKIIDYYTEREANSQKLTKLLEEIGKDFSEREVATMELHHGHDIHAFYQLNADSKKVIHLQAYPGMSNDKQARVYARMMDYDKMMSIRASHGVSIGNEHDAVIQPFANFEIGIFIPYDKDVLIGKLADNVDELG